MTQPAEIPETPIEVVRRALDGEETASALRVVTALADAGMLREPAPFAEPPKVRTGGWSGCPLDDA